MPDATDNFPFLHRKKLPACELKIIPAGYHLDIPDDYKDFFQTEKKDEIRHIIEPYGFDRLAVPINDFE